MQPIPFPSVDDVPVSEVMAWPVVSLLPDMTLLEVEATFNEHDINHAAIVDEHNIPIGIVSTTDLQRITNWRAYFQPEQQRASIDAIKASLLVADIMHRKPVCISEQATLCDVAQLLHQRRFHALPVLDGSGKLIGMVTAHDLLRAAYPVKAAATGAAKLLN